MTRARKHSPTDQSVLFDAIESARTAAIMASISLATAAQKSPQPDILHARNRAKSLADDLRALSHSAMTRFGRSEPLHPDQRNDQ